VGSCPKRGAIHGDSVPKGGPYWGILSQEIENLGIQSPEGSHTGESNHRGELYWDIESQEGSRTGESNP
jgi:hypothetical protein